MNSIATLYQLRSHLGFANDDHQEDQRLLDMLEAASTLIRRHTQRQFCPQVATIAHTPLLHDPTELLLKDDILELTGLYHGDGDIIDIESDVIVLASSILHLIRGQFIYDETPFNAVQVQGVWGWHDDWQNAWLNSADSVQDATLAADAPLITVQDADGADSLSRSPRFQVGQLLQIEAEYLRVLAVDSDANQLRVQRGVNGTTAATHTQQTAIMVYQPPPDAVNLCLRLATWLYREPDGYVGEELPRVIWRMLNRLRRLRVA